MRSEITPLLGQSVLEDISAQLLEKIVKEMAGEELVDRMHYCGGYREYWDGVKGLKEMQVISRFTL